MIEWLTFVFVNLLGAMSPGPDFAIVTRYGLTGSRKAAFLATAGIAAALLIHVGYCISGVGFFLKNSPNLFRSLQIVGAFYLGYLGVQALLAKKGKLEQPPAGGQAFRVGFLTNLLNPKATLFLLSLFAQFIHPDTSLFARLSFAATIPLIAIGWFGALSFFLTHPSFLEKFQKKQLAFTRVMGMLLLVLSLSVLRSALQNI